MADKEVKKIYKEIPLSVQGCVLGIGPFELRFMQNNNNNNISLCLISQVHESQNKQPWTSALKSQ